MKKCMLILKNGVTITISDEDTVSINGKNCNVTSLPKIIMIDSPAINIIQHETKEVNVNYYIPRDVISWCYVQEVIPQEVKDDEQVRD